MPKTLSAASPKTTKTARKTAVTPEAAADAPAGLTTTQLSVSQRLSAATGTPTTEVAAAEAIGRSTAYKALVALESAGLARREPGVQDGARKSPDLWFTAAPAADAQDQNPDTPDVAPVDDHGAQDASEGIDEADLPGSDQQGTAAVSEPTDDGVEPVTAAPDQDPDTTDAASGQDDGAPDVTDATGTADPTGDSADAAEPTGDEADRGVAVTSDAPTGNLDAEPAPSEQAGPRLGKGELRALVEQHLRDHPDQAWTPGKIGKILVRSAGAVSNAAGKLVEAGTAITFDDAPHRFQIAPAKAAKSTPRAAKAAVKKSAGANPGT